jgi:hypothetical protein
MPSGIGIQGVNEDKFEDAVEHNRQYGITLISTSEKGFGAPTQNAGGGDI